MEVHDHNHFVLVFFGNTAGYYTISIKLHMFADLLDGVGEINYF
jgi:hypothetical protein